MADQPFYIADNTRERERMRALIARLSDTELQHSVNPYWTVAGVLGHIAFWDGRALHLLDKWESGSAQPSHADDEPEDVDWVNDASRPLILAIPPRALAQLALNIAAEVDRRVEALSPELVAAIAAVGNPLNLSRANHRGEHLNEIAAALSR